jgi:thymidylate kinase
MHRDILQRIAKKFSSSNPIRTLIFWIFRFREAKKIREMQCQYDLILADRYIGTPYVFSICSGIPERVVMWLYKMIHPKPDLTLFLKVSLLEVRKRKPSETNKKGKGGFSKLLSFQYRCAAKKFGWQIIDALQSEDKVTADCAAFIFSKMKK